MLQTCIPTPARGAHCSRLYSEPEREEVRHRDRGIHHRRPRFKEVGQTDEDQKKMDLGILHFTHVLAEASWPPARGRQAQMLFAGSWGGAHAAACTCTQTDDSTQQAEGTIWLRSTGAQGAGMVSSGHEPMAAVKSLGARRGRNPPLLGLNDGNGTTDLIRSDLRNSALRARTLKKRMADSYSPHWRLFLHQQVLRHSWTERRRLLWFCGRSHLLITFPAQL
ncbi:unnamed protein product [Pleuronectes platessa]|uniref:Uncharacterized protein n=1 Tax=Pleuronectes platessa TaxID=8262 RepID=A0A9N7VEH6_PLEPL|nr:unnamed protein product [Pleuronectes platessa]